MKGLQALEEIELRNIIGGTEESYNLGKEFVRRLHEMSIGLKGLF